MLLIQQSSRYVKIGILWLMHLFLIPSYAIQLQLASLKESKEKNDQVIDTLQKTIEQKEIEIQHLSEQIAAIEGQLKEQSNILVALELKHTLELQDMKMKIIELKHQRDCACSASKLAQEESCFYAEALFKATKVFH